VSNSGGGQNYARESEPPMVNKELSKQ